MEEKRLRKLAGLNERVSSNPIDARDELTSRLERVFRDMEDLVLGPAVDTNEPGFDRAGVRKAIGLLKKIDSDLAKIEKNLDTLDNLGL